MPVPECVCMCVWVCDRDRKSVRVCGWACMRVCVCSYACVVFRNGGMRPELFNDKEQDKSIRNGRSRSS